MTKETFLTEIVKEFKNVVKVKEDGYIYDITKEGAYSIDSNSIVCYDFQEPQNDKRYIILKTNFHTVEIVEYKEECLIAELDKTKPSRPQRYASREVNGMDVIDLAEHWDLSFPEANILKYLLRNKGEDISDLEKIIDYANRRIKQLNK